MLNNCSLTEKRMILQLEHVTKNYRDQSDVIPVLKDINFSISAGETVALTGDSGSGKSTLLHIAAGLETPDVGKVLIGDQDISRLSESDRARVRRTDVSVIFQQFNLIPSITAEANIRFQAELSKRTDDAWINELVKVLGLKAHLGKYPEVLSGGQQQRVAIARSLAVRHPYLEPLHILQAELLRRDRELPEQPMVERALMASVAGIAAGMRNTG